MVAFEADSGEDEGGEGGEVNPLPNLAPAASCGDRALAAGGSV